MKKALSLITALLLIAGCSSPAKTETQASGDTQKVESTTPATEAPAEFKAEWKLPDQKEVGEAKALIVNQSGSSEGGKTITVLAGDNTILQIGYETSNFDGSKYTYIFVDGKESRKEQFGEMSQGTINLKENDLKPGIHNVEFIQWSEDDMKGDIIQYKRVNYEVKK